MEKLIYSLMNQNKNTEEKMASILNSKDHPDNHQTDVDATDSPLKKPAASNEPKNHTNFIDSGESPSFTKPSFT